MYCMYEATLLSSLWSCWNVERALKATSYQLSMCESRNTIYPSAYQYNLLATQHLINQTHQMHPTSRDCIGPYWYIKISQDAVFIDWKRMRSFDQFELIKTKSETDIWDKGPFPNLDEPQALLTANRPVGRLVLTLSTRAIPLHLCTTPIHLNFNFNTNVYLYKSQPFIHRLGILQVCIIEKINAEFKLYANESLVMTYTVIILCTHD